MHRKHVIQTIAVVYIARWSATHWFQLATTYSSERHEFSFAIAKHHVFPLNISLEITYSIFYLKILMQSV